MDDSHDPPQTRSAAPRRFQTRRGIQRTSKEDREAFARAETQRQAEAQRETERAAAAAARGTYQPRGRGRGALLGNANERTRNENSGGVFGAGRGSIRGRGRGVGLGAAAKSEAEIVEGPGAVAGGAGGERKPTIVNIEDKDTRARSKGTAGRAGIGRAAKKDELNIVSSDDEDVAEEGPRRDIETIEISSNDEQVRVGDDDDEEGPMSSNAKGKRMQKSQSQRRSRGKIWLRPVRAPRDTRETNELAGFSSRKNVQQSVKDRDKDFTQGGEYEPEGEPVDEQDDMDIEEVGQGPSAQDELVSLEARKKNKSKKGPTIKDPKFTSETIEERAERLRYAEDVRKLCHELSAMPPVSAPTGDVDMLSPKRLDHAAEKGRLYLFQFPPLTPMLADPSQTQDIQIKQEPTVEGSTATEPIAAPRGKDMKAPHIKKEEDAKEAAKAQAHALAEKAKMLMADGAHLPSGMAGRLNVHKSGKVSLEWGGTNMEVRWGSEVDFLQDIVLTGDEGDAFALGQVQKKMVVIPDWQKIYE